MTPRRPARKRMELTHRGKSGVGDPRRTPETGHRELALKRCVDPAGRPDPARPACQAVRSPAAASPSPHVLDAAMSSTPPSGRASSPVPELRRRLELDPRLLFSLSLFPLEKTFSKTPGWENTQVDCGSSQCDRVQTTRTGAPRSSRRTTFAGRQLAFIAAWCRSVDSFWVSLYTHRTNLTLFVVPRYRPAVKRCSFRPLRAGDVRRGREAPAEGTGSLGLHSPANYQAETRLNLARG